MDICQNCGHPVDNKYCPACGQLTATRRFDPKYLSEKLVDSFDIDRGFLRTLWSLIVKPGTAIREYVDGKRVVLYNPIRFFLITGTIATFLSIQLGFFEVQNSEVGAWMPPLPDFEGYAHYSGKYFSFFTLTGTLLFALFSFLLFRYTRMNYTENLVMNIYLASGQFLIVILFAPLLTYYPWTISIYGVVNFSYNIWILVTFFKAWSTKGIVRSLLAASIPLTISFYFNYLLYRLSPQRFWTFLDFVFG
jgi:hypothetical protein